MHTQRPAFWLVWNPQGQAPTRQHENKASAEREAGRLTEAQKAKLQRIGAQRLRDWLNRTKE